MILGKDRWKVITGDCVEQMKTLPDQCINCVITSPPYFNLRTYGSGDKEVGLEISPEKYVTKLVEVFHEARRVLKEDGTFWLNLGDSYCKDNSLENIKHKDLIGIPWMVAFALRADGWYLRSDIIWHKPNPMPTSCVDRCSTSHEYIFMFSKSPKYYFDYESIEEEAANDGRKDVNTEIMSGMSVHGMAVHGHQRLKFKKMKNMDETKGQSVHSMHANRALGIADTVYPMRRKRDVWTIATKGFDGDHFATYPEKLVEPCVLAGCPVGGIVLDPFNGAGTTGVVALKHGRRYIGIELNPKYVEISTDRIAKSDKQMTFTF